MTAADRDVPPSAAFTLRRYGVAVCSILIALVLWLVLFPVMGVHGESLVFLLAVLATVRLAGRGPGILATVGATLAVWYVFITPRFSFEIQDFRDTWSLALLCVSGISVSLFFNPSSPPVADATAGRLFRDFSLLRRAGALGVALVFLIFMIGLLYRDSDNQQDRNRAVNHTYQVLNVCQAVLSDLEDAESEARGYLLTGDEGYIQPLQTAIAAERASLETLRKLTADNRIQQSRMPGLERVAAKRTALLSRIVALRRAGRAAEALSVVQAGEGKRAMDEFRAAVAAILGEEQALLATRTARADLGAGRNRWLFGLGGGTLLILLVLAAAMIERDILNRERSRRALEESEHTTSSLLEAASLGVVGIDTAGKIALVNATAERIFGYSRLELLGQGLEMLVPENLRGRHLDHRANYVLSPVTRPMGAILDITCLRKDGSMFPGDISLCLVHTRQGPLAVSFITDITPRKLAEMERERILEALRASEDQLQRLNGDLELRVRDRTAELEAANKELETFAYSVAHNLRAPLRGIDGWCMAVVDDFGSQLGDNARSHLDRVRREAQYLGRLIDDLLRLSQVTRAPLRRECVDLTALARSIARDLQEIHAGRRIEFAIEPDLTVSGDAGLMQVVLTDLLGNAAKFTGKQALARIEFGRTECEGQPAFYVRDNGAGFDMAHAGLLFGPFQRLHKLSEFAGNGIGLATAHRIVHRHGGRIWAEAQVNRGATFYFTLH